MITQEERQYLIDSMSSLFEKYEYKYTEDAINKIIDKWATEKADLIAAFKKHPNYVDGKFMIAFVQEYERVENTQGSRDFSLWLGQNALEMTDIIPVEIKIRTRDEGCVYLPNKLWDLLHHLENIASRCISADDAEYLKEAIPEVSVHVGEKTSRAVNRICTYLNYHKIKGYNKEFAKYSDSLSPMMIKRRTVLSINPLDYLTMSFGNSWSSCHTIDVKNKRDMPNHYQGAYSSGTISYMLDRVSMVFYTLDYSKDETEYWDKPKITRQMFHYAQEKLVQGRLYPQSNDKFSVDYTAYRNIVQNIIANIFNFSNKWDVNTGSTEASRYIVSRGTHYRDYVHFNNCSISRIKNSTNEQIFRVGAYPICIRCGKEHEEAAHIDCCVVIRCKDCGRVICEDDAVTIDGEIYCKRCVHWCSMCNRYHRGRSTRIRDEHIDVCDNCLNEHFTRCHDCLRYVRKDKIINKDGIKLCKVCNNTITYTFDPSKWRHAATSGGDYKAYYNIDDILRSVRISFSDDNDDDVGDVSWLDNL